MTWALVFSLIRRFWPWALVCVAILFFALQLGRWRGQEAAREAAQARAATTIATGREKASSAAAEAIAAKGDRDLARAAETEENRDAILGAPNAGDDAGAAGNVGLERLCRRAINRDDPRCVRLRREGSAPASR